MRVELSKDVKVGIESYRDALYYYPISIDRIEAKVNNMRAFLMKLSTAIHFRKCDKEDLGQIKDGNNLLNNELFMTIYTDPDSKKQWGLSYTIDEDRDLVFVSQMKYWPFIKCSFSQKIDKPYKRIFDDVPMRKNVRYPVLTHILDCRNKHPELFYW